MSDAAAIAQTSTGAAGPRLQPLCSSLGDVWARVSIDSNVPTTQTNNVKRITLLLLLFSAMIGLAAQAPASVLAPMMPSTQQMGAASMHECKASMAKGATHKRCACTMTDCATLTAGAATLGNGTPALADAGASDRLEHDSLHAVLHGRSTGPEPDPPTHLI